MQILAMIISIPIFLAIRFLIGGEPWGVRMWITAAICLFIVRPIILALLRSMSGSNAGADKELAIEIAAIIRIMRKYTEAGKTPGVSDGISGNMMDRTLVSRVMGAQRYFDRLQGTATNWDQLGENPIIYILRERPDVAPIVRARISNPVDLDILENMQAESHLGF